MNGPDTPLDERPTIREFCAGQRVFGRFTLVRRLGRGGMGVVWLAHDGEPARRVALKFLPEVLAADAAALDELKRETDRALPLDHPNIVRIHEFNTGEAGAAISMELVEGDTLAALRHGRPEKVLEVWALAPLVLQLCEALDYAHTRARIVHRDLKPANLMVTNDGRLKVTDFGISASLSESTARLSRSAGPAGTLVYMSPQQLLGDAPAVSDDIYSLGATLYELITGKPPFHSGNIAAQVRSRTPPPLEVRRAELRVGGEEGPVGEELPRFEPIPAEWETTIAACLAKDPAERPRSALEVAVRLGLAAEAPVRATPREEADRGVLAKRDRYETITRAILCALVVVGAGYYFTVQVPAARRAAGFVPGPRIGPAAPEQGERWTIPDLGMQFMPVPGTDVLFSIWETRVQDFSAFVRATGHAATGEVFSYRSGTMWIYGDTWESPGFAQGPTNPVVGLDQADMRAFCDWLTRRERTAGRLAAGQEYRLPTEAEWRIAAGPDEFSWGTQWPPPAGAGNFAGEEGRNSRSRNGQDSDHLQGYADGAEFTAPVGQYAPNRFGLYDLDGNVWDCCHGGSFADGSRRSIRSGGGLRGGGDVRVGFRVVCALRGGRGD